MTKEKELDKIYKKNGEYLKGFETWLKDSGLKERTINEHLSNVKLFIFDYLCGYYDLNPKAEEGLDEVYPFLNGWFIEKCMWATENSIKTTLSSIKKFYKYMSENNFVDPKEYKITFDYIKDNMDTIYDNLEAIDNGTYWDMF